jgi:hypothetical protein
MLYIIKWLVATSKIIVGLFLLGFVAIVAAQNPIVVEVTPTRIGLAQTAVYCTNKGVVTIVAKGGVNIRQYPELVADSLYNPKRWLNDGERRTAYGPCGEWFLLANGGYVHSSVVLTVTPTATATITLTPSMTSTVIPTPTITATATLPPPQGLLLWWEFDADNDGRYESVFSCYLPCPFRVSDRSPEK